MCNICHGKGLLPFVKNGKVIPNAFVDCACKDSEPDHYREITPADFDFPCSDTFGEYFYYRYNRKGGVGWGNARAHARGEEIMPAAVVQPCTQSHDVAQVKGDLVSLRDALKQHVNESRKYKSDL